MHTGNAQAHHVGGNFLARAAGNRLIAAAGAIDSVIHLRLRQFQNAREMLAGGARVTVAENDNGVHPNVLHGQIKRHQPLVAVKNSPASDQNLLFIQVHAAHALLLVVIGRQMQMGQMQAEAAPGGQQ